MAAKRKKPRYAKPSRVNWVGVFFCILLLLAAIAVALFLLLDKAPENPQETTPTGTTAAVQTSPSSAPTIAPTIEPTIEPTIDPTIEPTIEPTVEPTPPTPGSDLTSDNPIAACAISVLGKPYLLGGIGPDAFDTSGFIYYCFRECGISAPRKLSEQAEFGEPVEKDAVQPGDVVFFHQSTPGKPEYPGIYIGDGKFIAVSSSNNAVEEKNFTSTYFTERFVCARRYQ